MKSRKSLCPLLLLVALMIGSISYAQQYDLLIKGGHLIDPKNNIDSVMDIAITGDRIAAVESNIPPGQANRVIDATGLYVSPGLVDLHAHVFYGTEPNASYSNGYSAIPPDGFTFRSGVTTVVDVGGAGWRNFPQFKQQVIDRVRTRVLAFLNIVGSGMKGGPVEQNLNDMDPKLTAMRILEYPQILVGIKAAHYMGPEWDPVDRAVKAGEIANVPVMVDFGRNDPPLSLEALLLKHLRPGDILTHTYAHVSGREPIVGENGKVKPFVFKARERGLIFDVGHGGGSFLFRQAIPALQQGFPPDSMGTDIHVGSMNGGMKDMLNVASKFLNLGMSLKDVVAASTWKPAQIINRPDLGHLGVGAEADLAVINLRSGNFGFIDVGNGRFDGTQKLECELTLRSGRVVWDLNGLAAPKWDEMNREISSR
ncbi:MAG TPA: amidohydrolase/deacetylase family metallohydrolase [Acidobacteriota bacterium]|nr:amidohydrolase/deacetylase family metallohydrolase [Acidobacteriota bacterium]